MSGIDNRIVTMQFNNREFERNAQTSMSTLQKLKQAMNFGNIGSGAMKGISSIGSSIGKLGMKTPFAPLISGVQKGVGVISGLFDKLGLKNPFARSLQGASELQKGAQQVASGMGVLDGAVTGVSSKFIALSTIAITALSNITNRALSAAGNFVKGFSFGPIMDGLHEYELNLKSIQTIQANTDRPLPEITRALDQLNHYSDQTIYNFSEMAKNVGTFTAAGVDLKTSVSSIKGIANLAALSGSSSEQAATAMYQLSQAIAAGKVGLMDWNSVVNAGMGGKKLQNALAQTAVAMGKIDANSVKMVGPMKKLTINGNSFRESIMAKPGQESWLSSDILVNTLATMDGRFSRSALAAERTATGVRKYSDAQITAKIATARANMEQKNGVKYTDEQFAALQKMSTMAFKSATEVKTLGQVFDVAKETIGSGWGASFRNIFGNLNQAKALFTGMSNGLNDIINQNAQARNTLLINWAKGGGRLALIDGLKAAWTGFYSVIQAVGKGFRDIFPKHTASDLISMSKGFAAFMHSLIPGEKTLANIRDIAGGVFAIFGIGKTILGGLISGLKVLFQSVGAGNGNFLDLAGGLGNALKGLNEFLKRSGIVTAIFVGLGHILAIPIKLVATLGSLLANLFKGINLGSAGKLGDVVSSIGAALGGLTGVGNNVKSAFSGLGTFFVNLGAQIGNALLGIGDAIASSFNGATFDRVLNVIKTGLLAGILVTIRSFFKSGMKIDVSGGFFDNIKQTLGSVTGAFQSLQNNLKADTLRSLAISIGLMAGSLLILSTIDPGKLTKALTAMTAGFAVLIGAMFAMMKVMGPVGLAQLHAVALALIQMSVAIFILSGSLKVLSGIKFGDMLRGLLGLSVMLKIITKAALPLAAGSKGMIRASASLILIGVAIGILAAALKLMATMSWGELIKGLVGMAAGLAIMGAAAAAIPGSVLLVGPGLLIMAAGITIMAAALKVMGTMSWSEIVKGLVALAGALTIIGLAAAAIPASILIVGPGLLIVASALTVLSAALKVMGGMSWSEVVKGLVTLGGAMLILAVGLNAISGTAILGAAALMVTAAALAVLTPVLVTLGAMSWGTLLKSLTALAAVFTILGVAGYLLAPVVPVILGLGAALLLIGAGAALAGAGIMLAAAGLTMLTAAASAGIAVMVAALKRLIGLIPLLAKNLGVGLVNMVKSIGRLAPTMINSFSRILSSMLRAVIRNVPLMGKVFTTLIQTAVRVVNRNAPSVINAGFRMIIGFLRKIDQNIGRITSIAISITTKFINTISRRAPALANAGVRMIISFINATARAIDKHSGEMGKAGGRLGVAIVRGIASGIAGGLAVVANAALNLAKHALQTAKNFLSIKSPSRVFRDEVGARISEGMALGIRDTSDQPVKEIQDMGKRAVIKMSKVMEGVNDAFALDPNLNPVVTPVLDLGALTQEANKMSSILATAPIMPSVSYNTAADISSLTQASADNGTGPGYGGGSGDTYLTYEQNLHSPKAIDSVEAYRAGKSLIALVKGDLP